jgi:hypothetical protein
MKPTRLLLPLGLALLVLAGCSSSGGDDAATTTKADASTASTEAPTTTEATSTTSDDAVTTTEAGGSDATVPTYEDAKRVYLAQADDATKASCEQDQEDRDVVVSSGTYTRLMCGGMERFEYIEGSENYEKNWPTISGESVYRSILHVPGELIVVPSGSNDDFAPALADDCGCGEVVQQQG